MDPTTERRMRLAQLLDLAQTYKGWTRKQLAKALGRDPTKLIPGSGVPKLDFVIDLAGVLDWAVDDVVAHLWGRDADQAAEVDGSAASEFESLDEQAQHAHRDGGYRLMVDLAHQAFEVAGDANERARACNREAGGWDGMGRYTNVLRAVQRGLVQTPVDPEFRRTLKSNLANAYYSLWSLVEAKAIARELTSRYETHPPTTLRDRKTQAFAHYVSGHTYRRLIGVEPDEREMLAAAARSDLVLARDLYQDLAAELEDDSFAGIANTCHGGLVEVDVTLGRLRPDDALDELTDGLERIWAAAEPPVGDWLESYGWWCIFGCNIALRHLDDERVLQQRMAVFTNKADEIAEQLDNWSMRERVFTMDHSRWERAVGCTGFDIPRLVDEDDVRIITGTMARFPSFRETGWQILHSAKVIRGS